MEYRLGGGGGLQSPIDGSSGSGSGGEDIELGSSRRKNSFWNMNKMGFGIAGKKDEDNGRNNNPDDVPDSAVPFLDGYDTRDASLDYGPGKQSPRSPFSGVKGYRGVAIADEPPTPNTTGEGQAR